MCLNTVCANIFSAFVLLCLTPAAAFAVPGDRMADPAPPVSANDNRTPAGELQLGVLHLHLRASRGAWRPEGERGRALLVEAFGEVGKPLQVPAPLIRVRQGTAIVARIRNDLDSQLRIHGLCSRDGTRCLPIDVAPGETRELLLESSSSGTYHYWATTSGMPLSFRGAADTQLSGAFVVDPADGPIDPDRILVITEWTGLTPAQLREIGAHADPGAAFLKLRPDVFFALNGLSWPHTERFAYDLGDHVRWRVVNLSTQAHPMHMHGFYFDVERQGDGATDTAIPANDRLHVVTHLMAPGSTMSLTWKPERVGRWLFHCHTMVHVSPTLHVDGSARAHAGHDAHHDPGFGMTGLVLGIEIRERRAQASAADRDDRSAPRPAPRVQSRRLTLTMQSEPRRFGDAPALGFLLAEGGDMPSVGPVPIPGPLLVLRRDQPVEITLVNRLSEATSIHWHGMELESYYDGVHGWSGTSARVTPMIAPGDRLVVRFTPPRAGTFIYHTHLHDNRQLTSGLYGALVVLDPEERFDAAFDHVLVIGRGGPSRDAPVVINGDEAPAFDWKADARHRVRLINITPNDTVAISLRSIAEPVMWRLVSKDGATVSPAQATLRPASQIVGVGETYDFEFDAAPGRQGFWLEVRSPGGRWYAQGRVFVR